MQMTDKRGEDFPEPWIFGPGVFAEHRLGNVLLIFDDHISAPEWLGGRPARLILRDRLGGRYATPADRLAHIRPSSRSSRRSFSGMAAAPGAALSRSRGASLSAK